MLSAIVDFVSRPEVLTVLSVLWLLYVLVLAVWIIMLKRSPVATVAWLISLAGLPYIGFFIFYFLGPQRVTKQRLRRLRAQVALMGQRDLQALRKASAESLTAPWGRMLQLMRLGNSTGDGVVTTATQVDLLVGGAATFDAIFDAIRAARHHVHLEYYIYEPDFIGTALQQLLIARARDGLEVRLLVDALGSKRLGRSFFDPLREAGVQVGLFHSVRLGRRLRPVTNFRTHRKIVVCDGAVGFIGGVNVTDEEDLRTRPDAYHDVHLRVRGSVVHSLQAVFLEDWVYTTGERLRLRDEAARALLLPPLAPGPHAVQILASGPDTEMEPIHRMMVAGIHAARMRLWLTTPYFVPTEAALMALTNAALRGVDVRVLVPARSDSRIVSAAARSYYGELQAAGVRIWEYRERMLHSKTMVVDEACAFIGTANFDTRSFRLNYEICAVAYGDGLVHDLAHQFEVDLRESTFVRPGRKAGFAARLGEATARLFSPVL